MRPLRTSRSRRRTGAAPPPHKRSARAQRLAETARASGLANLILSDRANAAIQRDDLRGARSLIKLAFERSDRDPAAIRFRVLYVATSVADLQADRPAALAYSRDALAVFPSDVPVVLRKDVVTIERLRAHGLEATNALAEAKATIRRAVDHAR